MSLFEFVMQDPVLATALLLGVIVFVWAVVYVPACETCRENRKVIKEFFRGLFK